MIFKNETTLKLHLALKNEFYLKKKSIETSFYENVHPEPTFLMLNEN